MKLWELIVELERLEQLGKRDYDIAIDCDDGVEKPLQTAEQISCSNQYHEIILG